MNATPLPCKHCAGTERYAQEISAAGGYGPDLLPIGFFVRRRFRIEVCGACGHVEWFVPDRFLEKVKAQFTRIS